MFSTNQLALAAYLLTIGFELADCAPANRVQCSFFFKDPARKAIQAASDYDNGATCPAKAMIANVRKLRRMAEVSLGVQR
jgi:hypothetical protein